MCYGLQYKMVKLVDELVLHLDLQMESHLGLMKELSWVLHMATLVVLMKSNLTDPC